MSSPIFDDGADFISGSIDCGTGQFIDTFQRCNFWSQCQTNTGYHTIIDYTKIKKPNKLKPLKITVTAAQGSIINNPFGSGVVGTYPINNVPGRGAHLHDVRTTQSSRRTRSRSSSPMTSI